MDVILLTLLLPRYLRDGSSRKRGSRQRKIFAIARASLWTTSFRGLQSHVQIWCLLLRGDTSCALSLIICSVLGGSLPWMFVLILMALNRDAERMETRLDYRERSLVYVETNKSLAFSHRLYLYNSTSQVYIFSV